MSIAIDKLTPVQLETYIHLQSQIDRQNAEADRIKALREYYDGEHRVMLTERQKEYLGPLVSDDTFTFCHNLMRPVVDTLAERLSVIGFDAGEEEEGGQSIAESLWGWWEDNRFDIQEAEVYTAALRDGAAFVMVDYDNDEQRPRFTMHLIDDGDAGIVVHFDPGDRQRVIFATRYWWQYNPLLPSERAVARKTMYFPDAIYKYRLQGDTRWEQVRDVGDTSWPLPWVDGNGEALGVAVIPFRTPGGSRIAQIIGMQNVLNKSWLDLVAAADANGFPILAFQYPDGAPVGEDDANISGTDEMLIAPGRAIEVDRGNVNRIAPGDLAPLREMVWTTVDAISGITRTPQSYLRPQGGSDVASGESLKQLESGLVAQALRVQRVFGQSWADVMKLALRVNATFAVGREVGLPKPRIMTKWESPETRNDLTVAQTAQIHKALGIPDEQIWMLLGYTSAEIEDFTASASARRASDVAMVAQAINAKQTTPATVSLSNGVVA
ncbi:MAG: phage portal protein [Solirubrobacterales bacterium]